MKRIAEISISKLRDWLPDFSAWYAMTDRDEFRLVEACTYILVIQDRVTALRLAFNQLGIDEEYMTDLRDVLTDIQKAITSLLLSEATRKDVARIILENVETFKELDQYYLQCEEKTSQFRKADVLDVLPHISKKEVLVFEAIWEPFLRRLFKELSAICKQLQEASQDEESKLATAASKLGYHKAEILRDISRRIQLKKQARSEFVGAIQQLNERTAKFLRKLAKNEPHLYDMREVKNFYGAEVEDELILKPLAKFHRTRKKGLHSYTVYVLDDVPILYYDGWLITADRTILEEIESGKVAMRRKSARTIPLRAAVQKVSAVLRCTFTSNANFDDTFVDWLRSMNAKKVGPNTWDVPTKDSKDIANMKAKFTQYGYPFIYENIETPSVLVDLYDTGVGGKLASLVKVQYLPKKAVIRKEEHDGKHYLVLRSGENPTSSWAGIYVEYTPGDKESLARAKKQVKAREKQVQYFKREKAARTLTPDAIQRVTDRLASVAKHPIVSAKYAKSIAKMIRDVPVVSELLIADNAQTLEAGTALLSPEVGSSIHVNGSVYWVTGNAFKDPYGWLTVEDGQNNPYIVTKPDANDNVGILPKLEYEKLMNETSISDMTGLQVEPEQMAPIPVIIIVDTGAGPGFDGGQLPMPMLDQMAPMTDTPIIDEPPQGGCGCGGGHGEGPEGEGGCGCGHQEEEEEGEQVLPMIEGDSPMGGLENQMYLHSPTSPLPPIDYNTGRGVLYYPTPDMDVLTPIEQERNVPISLDQEIPTEQMYDTNKIRQVELYQDDPDGGAPQSVTFGPHPNSSKRGPDPSF